MNAWRIEAVQSEALWERVVSALRRAILMGELTPDTHLKEPLLAQRFGVSRLPIREAIAQLDREGLVRVEPRRGAFVIGVSDQDISDIYECRMLLELGAIPRAAARADDQALGELEDYVTSMDEAVAASQPQALAAADLAFHRRIVTLSGNRALVNAWAPVAPLIETILGISDATCASTDLPEAVEGHRRIIRALAQHDADAAVDILKVHLAGGESLVHEAIRAVRVQ